MNEHVLFYTIKKSSTYSKKKERSIFTFLKYSIFEYLNARVLFTTIKKMLYVLNFEYVKARSLRDNTGNNLAQLSHCTLVKCELMKKIELLMKNNLDNGMRWWIWPQRIAQHIVDK